MAYNDNPTGCLADLVRVKAGDTADPPVLSDEAVQAFLEINNNNILLASAEAAEALAAYYAQNQVDIVGDVSGAATKTQNYLRIADRLRAQAAEANVGPEAKPCRPGYSSAALNRGSIFTRGLGYGGE